MSYSKLLEENIKLKQRIAELEETVQTLRNQTSSPGASSSAPSSSSHEVVATIVQENKDRQDRPLSNDQIYRYGRQLILPEWGIHSQAKLCQSRVLVVGAGGLGAPVCLYLAACGVGQMGIIDMDTVDVSNLHRQVIHSEAKVGINKAQSARMACLAINSSIKCEAYAQLFNEDNAMDLVAQYDIIVDATDNVAARYLINDAAILNKKVVVSGSALRMEGQVTIYGYRGGPCYRCLYPVPPPPETVTNCSDGGVLGVIPGIIGCIQALEVMKVAAESEEVLSQRLLLFDGVSSVFRTVKLRGRNPNCAVCGDQPTVKELVNYTQFCSSAMHDKPKNAAEAADHQALSISAKAYKERATTPHVLLDVREKVQFDICSLPNSVHIPLRELNKRLDELYDAVRGVTQTRSSEADSKSPLPVYVLCRRGVDSLTATRLLRNLPPQQPDHGKENEETERDLPALHATNIAGGLSAWSRFVDPDFPLY